MRKTGPPAVVITRMCAAIYEDRKCSSQNERIGKSYPNSSSSGEPEETAEAEELLQREMAPENRVNNGASHMYTYPRMSAYMDICTICMCLFAPTAVTQ